MSYWLKRQEKPRWDVGIGDRKVFVLLESFLHVSGQSGKFLDSLESYLTVWNFFGQSGKFLDSLVIFGPVSDSLK